MTPRVVETHDLGAVLRAGGVQRGTPVALVAAVDGTALAWHGGDLALAGTDAAEVVAALADLDPRWVWWSAATTAAPMVRADVRPRTCWDLGAVGRLRHGLRRDDPAAVWAAEQCLPAPPEPAAELDLLDLVDDAGDEALLRADGQLSRRWTAAPGDLPLTAAVPWARLGLVLQGRQQAALVTSPDRRVMPTGASLPLVTAWSESAAALLAVELEHDGLPLDRVTATDLLTALIGPEPADEADEAAARTARDAPVRAALGDAHLDLRNPASVREALARNGFDVPDTRAWRLEPHATTSPAVAALLHWRRVERLATTYGWHWLRRAVSDDGRLRGSWSAADAAAGRMTAQAGLHSLPAELRSLVRAEPGFVLVRADLGQIEPRVLAAVSHDVHLAAAARADDMYAPVAAALRCDRPTAKVAVLAAMYGQTSGAAGAALRDMDRAYPTAMAYLRTAEECGRSGTDLRTYGGRLVRLDGLARVDPPDRAAAAAYGRYARNAVVQGAAAELFKAWAATVRDTVADTGARIVLCLHDELLLHVPQGQAPTVVAALHASLDSTASWWAAGSGVRFVAEVGVGDTWEQAH